ncbi:MAG: citrate synthase [Bryobacterales bacterium]|nr:citrate synthase [Bryobacterales bacterium]
MSTPSAGLEGVIAAESSICYIDGQQGILSYQGYNIHVLAECASFEEVIYLLWHGYLPTARDLAAFQQELLSQRHLPDGVRHYLGGVPLAPPMDVMRTAVSMLAQYDPESASHTPEANRRKAFRLMAKTATVVADFERLRKGARPVEPCDKLGYAANFLYMLTGKQPLPEAVHALDVALILHADHEFNASTFAARVAAATLSDLYAACTAGLATLKGPLHGGANEQVIQLLLKLKTPEEGEALVRETFARKDKMPGFGHRVYRTEDPRATHLRALAEQLSRAAGQQHLYAISRRIEDTVKSLKPIYPNVDFYSATAYYAMGIPVDMYTPIFGISRMSGYIAHVLEQYANNRLIRPRADYKGNPDGRAWLPLEAR